MRTRPRVAFEPLAQIQGFRQRQGPVIEIHMRESWPHAPPHYFMPNATYIITAGYAASKVALSFWSKAGSFTRYNFRARQRLRAHSASVGFLSQPLSSCDQHPESDAKTHRTPKALRAKSIVNASSFVIRASSFLCAPQFRVEPYLRKFPVAPCGNPRNLEHLCDLVVVQPAKILQLDYLRFSRVECGQLFQCLV